MDNKDLNNEELTNVAGAGDPIVVDMDAGMKCPACKSFNFVPVLSQRVGAFNKVTFRCADCQHKWESMILIQK
ncbi:hypothetical protein SAMN02910456_00132 [Ruminococcaceae bacterium YRB3002]|nr:hypothetical protein SAMN02910456_00132 [Ruminococcaceae bacterium YRB3002]